MNSIFNHAQQDGLKLAIIGDLHWEKSDEALFQKARTDLLNLSPQGLICMGDLGGYSHPGSELSFQEGKSYLSSFGLPFFTLIGNHDIEGKEFSTDEENIQAWQKVFNYPKPYYLLETKFFKAIFLSSTRFRKNIHSCHEVFIDEEQLSWFSHTIENLKGQTSPLFIFSHAPILGSNIRVLQNLHLKVPNAYLNHTHQPEFFFNQLKKLSQPVLWFSAHNHLGQHYENSISLHHNLAFIHTGVIGSISRDGYHHSRILEVSSQKLTVSTLDHSHQSLYPCLTLELEATEKALPGNQHVNFQKIESIPSELSKDHSKISPLSKPDTLLVESIQNPSELELSRLTSIATPSTIQQIIPNEQAKRGHFYYPPPSFQASEGQCIGNSHFQRHQNQLVEYHLELQAPLGVVTECCDSFYVENDELWVIYNGKKKQYLYEKERGGYFKVAYPNRWKAK